MHAVQTHVFRANCISCFPLSRYRKPPLHTGAVSFFWELLAEVRSIPLKKAIDDVSFKASDLEEGASHWS